MSGNNATSTNPPTSEPPASSSTPVSLPSSSQQESPSSSAPPPSSTPPSSTPQDVTTTRTASSRPPSTQVLTSVVTPSVTSPGESVEPSTIVLTVTQSDNPQSTAAPPTTSVSTSSTDPASANGVTTGKSSGGLSTGGKTAIAVVVPVVVVALLVIAGILLWRRRKSKKNEEEARRKEVEEYGFNPNHDPTLPAVGMASEMQEDQSGYRGWGNTTTSSNRKGSTTLNSGMTHSDSNSNPGGYQSPGSPTQARSDGASNDPLVDGRRETLDSEGIGALGAGPSASQNQAGVHRGPSNASSSYSAANRSDNSGDYPIPMNNPQDYYDNNGYYQSNPYNDGYGGGQQPVIRDVSARRNTRIENPSVFPQQGNSGIAQNF